MLIRYYDCYVVWKPTFIFKIRAWLESKDIIDFMECSGMAEKRSDKDKQRPPHGCRLYPSNSMIVSSTIVINNNRFKTFDYKRISLFSERLLKEI